MANTASAVSKMPVEMWREIFHLCLGTEYVDIRGWLRTYEFLRGKVTEITDANQIRAGIRGTLSLVCRRWRDVLADMDDNMVVAGPDGAAIWPPGRRMEHAKHAVYVSNTSYYLWKHGEPWWGVNGGNLGSSYTMNIDQLDAPIIQLIGVNLEATAVERCLDPRGGNIKALSVMFGIDRTTAFSFRALTHPRLQHLVALSFETRYPLKISEPFSLPSVRCLFVKLRWYYGLDREQDTLSKLTFPKLSAFELTPKGVEMEGLKTDVEGFLLTHAETIEEVVLREGFCLSETFDVDKSLGRLWRYERHPSTSNIFRDWDWLDLYCEPLWPLEEWEPWE
ncbi:hypothetical protein PIIN_08684 [Serendipita indica DSM 11827]|uniref:Uncharacterized protein n=1 Tax=Serendipita indica (strain DSM 11827) TaxID=1109443 RepID=G4TTT1_SERID|nr:hypothetical protein PIIN_08684 [Serendipita indica DSM 11827]